MFTAPKHEVKEQRQTLGGGGFVAPKHEVQSSGPGFTDHAMSFAKRVVGSFPNAVSTIASLAGGPQEALGTLSASKFNENLGEGTELLGGNVAEGLAKHKVPVPLAATAGFVAQNAPYFMMPTGKAPMKPLSALEGPAVGLARRSLGFSKRFLNRPGAIENANKVAKAALEEGIIRPLSGTEATLGRAETMKEMAGEGIGNMISQLGASGRQAFKTSDVLGEIENQLMTKLDGGDFEKKKRIVDQIMKTVKGAGKGGFVGFDDAQELRQTLKEFGANFEKQAETVKSTLYKRAYGIINQAMERGAKEVLGKGVGLKGYLRNKNLYGAGKKMVSTLTDKAAAEAGNAVPGLRGTAVAAAELASGNPIAAAASLGAIEGLKRMGAGTTASLLNSASKTRIAPVFLKALLASRLRNQEEL